MLSFPMWKYYGDARYLVYENGHYVEDFSFLQNNVIENISDEDDNRDEHNFWDDFEKWSKQ